MRELPLMPLPYSIGRSPTHSLCLQRATVSSNHAEFRIEGDSLILRDLKSTNGTYVNGHRINTDVAIKPNDLVQFADVAFRVGCGESHVGMKTIDRDVSNNALTLIRFDVLMSERAFEPYFQPIFDMRDETIVGFEALGRSGIFGLESPGAMFAAAACLNMEDALSRELRRKALEVSLTLGTPPPHVFINTHPAELHHHELVDSLRTLRKISPDQPITLEIHEQACTGTAQMHDLRSELKELRMSLAYDDFGAGQARLRELVEVPPDYLKFDMGLLRGIDQRSAGHRGMVGALVQMVRELNIVSIAEGIETEAEAKVCRELGFHCVQGYLYGRPLPPAEAAKRFRHA